MDRKDWNRIGLVAAIFLVPGGFILGGALAARRAGKAISDSNDAKTADAADALLPTKAPVPAGSSDPT